MYMVGDDTKWETPYFIILTECVYVCVCVCVCVAITAAENVQQNF